MGSPNHLLLAIGLKKKQDTPQPPRSLRDQLMNTGTEAAGSPSRPGQGPASASTYRPGSTGAAPSSSSNGMSGLIPGMDGAGSQPGGGGGVAGAGAKASRDDAGFIPAGQICGACENFTKQTGDCSKVEGTFQAHDTCKVYFEASNGAGEMPGENEGLESTPGMGGGGGGQSTPPTSSPRSSIGTMNA